MNRKLYVPKNAKKYLDEFIVFYSDKSNPTVLFHSPIAEKAYEFAKSLVGKNSNAPTVIRISERKKTGTETIGSYA